MEHSPDAPILPATRPPRKYEGGVYETELSASGSYATHLDAPVPAPPAPGAALPYHSAALLTQTPESKVERSTGATSAVDALDERLRALEQRELVALVRSLASAGSGVAGVEARVEKWLHAKAFTFGAAPDKSALAIDAESKDWNKEFQRLQVRCTCDPTFTVNLF